MEPTFDKCPGYNLYIGGFIGLRRTQALKNCNITHIVSALDWEFKDDSPLLRGYHHLHIPVDDVDDENLLEWFPKSNRFVHQGLHYSPNREDTHGRGVDHLDGRGSGVYIHCAMGKSRSATVLLAYLLWASRQGPTSQKHDNSEDMVPLPPKPLSVIEALELLRQGRPIAEPNEGFMDQLHMYEDMGCPSTEEELKSHKIYRRWMKKRQVEESLRTMQAPELDAIIFEDEDASSAPDTAQPSQTQQHANTRHMTEVMPGVLAPDGTDETKSLAHPSSQPSRVTIKCRKCRHILATTPFLIDHKPPPHRDPSSDQTSSKGSILPPAQCAHIFLHPLSWMREVLAEGKMEGRLTCPNKKCNSNIGKFAWTGLRCSCGGWVTPGFGIIRTKIDESVSRGSVTAASAGRGQSNGSNPDKPSDALTSSMTALRLPPNMKKQGNL